jgi:hypothetical protein
MNKEDYRKWLLSADAIMVNNRWIDKVIETTSSHVLHLLHRDAWGGIYELTIIEEALEHCVLDGKTLLIQDKSGKPHKVQRLFIEK